MVVVVVDVLVVVLLVVVVVVVVLVVAVLIAVVVPGATVPLERGLSDAAWPASPSRLRWVLSKKLVEVELFLLLLLLLTLQSEYVSMSSLTLD